MNVIVGREARRRDALEDDQRLPCPARTRSVPIDLDEGIRPARRRPKVAGREGRSRAVPPRQIVGHVGQIERVATGSGGEIRDDVGLQGRGGIARVVAVELVGVAPGAAGQRVDAARAAATGIGDIAEGIVAVAAREAVGAVIVTEVVVARPAQQGVVAGLAIEIVVASSADQNVRARSTAQRVAIGAAVEGIVAAVAVERVFTRPAQQRVVALRTVLGLRRRAATRRISDPVRGPVRREVVRAQAGRRDVLQAHKGLPGATCARAVPIDLDQGVRPARYRPEVAGREGRSRVVPPRQVARHVGQIERVTAGSSGEIRDDVGLQGRGGIARVVAVELVGVAPCATGQRVDAARAPSTGVGDIAEGIVAVAARETVGAVIITEVVVARPAQQGVVAGLAIEIVVASSADEDVRARSAAQRVAIGAAIEGIVAAVAVKRVVTRRAGQRVVAITAVQAIVRVGSDDRRALARRGPTAIEIIESEGAGRYADQLDERLPTRGGARPIPIDLDESIRPARRHPEIAGREGRGRAVPAREVVRHTGEIQYITASSSGEICDDVGFQGGGRIAGVVAVKLVGVAPCAAGQRVDAARAVATSITDIREYVVTIAAGDNVSAFIIAEVIVTVVARQGVVVRPAVQCVVAGATIQPVRTRITI